MKKTTKELAIRQRQSDTRGVLHIYIYVALPWQFSEPQRDAAREKREMMSGNEKLVCVTGASGYIASWLVKLLLNHGYTVRASVRDTYDRTKTAHLKAMTGANERLKLFEADLLKDGSFYSGIQDCVAVFHTASPFKLNSKNPEEEVIKPAVNGTLNVLKSCAQNPSLKRVVLTSSTAAVIHNGWPRTPDVVVDETWYSTRETCEKLENRYPLSKMLAEEEAWKFANKNGIDLVTINPATVLGPLLQPTLNTSAEVILSLINGEKTYINDTYGWVNVKDVAKAHIRAYEDPSASGRYLMVENVFSCFEIVEMIRELYPSIPLPEKCADDNPRKPTYQFSKKRAKSLEINNFIPTKTGLKEIIKSLIERGLVKF